MWGHFDVLRIRAVALVFGLTLLTQPGSLAAEEGACEDLVRLPGHVLPALKGATLAPAAAGAEAQPLTLTIVLNRTDPIGFARYLHEVYDPGSPGFHRFLTQIELSDQFGPTQETYDAVLRYLQQNGFTLLQGSANRLTLSM